jgi:hypothetical protein
MLRLGPVRKAKTRNTLDQRALKLFVRHRLKLAKRRLQNARSAWPLSTPFSLIAETAPLIWPLAIAARRQRFHCVAGHSAGRFRREPKRQASGFVSQNGIRFERRLCGEVG